MGAGMQKVEHTPQPAPPSQNEREPHIEFSTHTIEIHVKTIPSDEDHNPSSQIDKEIDKNPALYRGEATF